MGSNETSYFAGWQLLRLEAKILVFKPDEQGLRLSSTINVTALCKQGGVQ